MSTAAAGEPAREPPLGTAIAALTVTQLLGWGSTFHLPAILADRLSAGTGLAVPFVFGGITLMLLVAAALSPLAGRLLERDGAPGWMALGSVTFGVALVVLSVAEGPATFMAAWALFGAAMPFALNQGASTALVQISPNRARNGIALVLLLTGISTTVSWPALIWLDTRFGWRTGLLLLAASHVLVCAPLHAFALAGARRRSTRRGATAGEGEAGATPPVTRLTFAITALSLSLAGMLTWGLPLHMVAMLRDLGHSEESAVWIGTLLGPGQVLARALELMGGRRLGILTVAIGATALMPAALALLLLFGSTVAGAVAFSVGYGLSAGLISIVRAVLPLRLFGTRAYAVVLGRLGLPQNIGFAVAPLGFAALRELSGVTILVATALAIGIVSFLATVELARRAPTQPPD